ncbi:hypothetical protein E2C01_063328 [Portunus trituberculatus]|uniref:Uncharacterized protein n=1 Tax=Portunus trituberculatus TaxID=210409 RepID=A0A5B7HG19_PORTR|nr:hypothetical protein [Portunus trituberculatus]
MLRDNRDFSPYSQYPLKTRRKDFTCVQWEIREETDCCVLRYGANKTRVDTVSLNFSYRI